MDALYTLLQKKRNFSEPIFPSDPGSLTLTPGHVHFVNRFFTHCYQEHWQNEIHYKVHLSTLFPKETQLSKKSVVFY